MVVKSDRYIVNIYAVNFLNSFSELRWEKKETLSGSENWNKYAGW
jgi:hypothetical protein